MWRILSDPDVLSALMEVVGSAGRTEVFRDQRVDAELTLDDTSASLRLEEC